MGIGYSSSKTTVTNAVEGAIQAAMDSQVRGSINVACQNLQIAENVRDCDIQFADQVCNAVGVSNFTSNTALTGDLSQDIMSEISAHANASTSGITLQLAQVSNSSSVIDNYTKLAMNVSQSFMTDCTRNISAINEQAVKDCAGSVLKFQPQEVSAEVIGDCVANQVGSLQAAQSVKNLLDAGSTATTEGVDIAELTMFMLITILGGGLFLYAIRTGLFARLPGQAPPSDGEKRRFQAIQFFLLMLFLSCVLWYPGLGAWYLRIAPWPYNMGSTGTDGLPSCWGGRNLDESTFVNTFMWWDPYCLAKSAAIEENPEKDGGFCDTDTQKKHYHQCGLFATTGGCDDPEFKQAEASYIRAVEACGKLQGATFDQCDVSHIANQLFPDVDGTYPKCKRCVGESDEEKRSQYPRALYGMWVQDNKKCDYQSINPYYYQKGDHPCPPDDPYCKDKIEDLLAVSPNDCEAVAYQSKKRQLSQFLRACDQVQQTNAVTFATKGSMPLVAEQCPPQIFRYLTKCNAGSKRCTYKAQGCVCDAKGENCDCSNADPYVVASCRNDLEACCTRDERGELRCRDPDYQRDRVVYEIANDLCRKNWERYKSLNPLAWQITLGVYLFTFFAILYLILTTPNATARIGYGFRQAGSSNSSVGFFALIAIGMIIGGAVLIARDPEKERKSKNFTLDDIQDRVTPYAVFFSGLGMVVIAVIGYFNKPKAAKVVTKSE